MKEKIKKLKEMLEPLSVKEKIEALKYLFLEVGDRYRNPDGTFKQMTCPDNPDDKSKFCGCVRYMMSQGKSLEAAKKICAYIARMKGK